MTIGGTFLPSLAWGSGLEHRGAEEPGSFLSRGSSTDMGVSPCLDPQLKLPCPFSDRILPRVLDASVIPMSL